MLLNISQASQSKKYVLICSVFEFVSFNFCGKKEYVFVHTYIRIIDDFPGKLATI